MNIKEKIVAQLKLRNLMSTIDRRGNKYIQPLKNKLLSGLKGRVFTLPSQIQVSLSDRCNFHCTTCWIHGQKVVADKNNLEACLFSSLKPSLMNLEVYKILINDIAQNSRLTTISFCGKGEPTLNPDFQEMIMLADEKGLKSSLVTNGSRLTFDILKNLHKAELGINISLNACDVNSHKAFNNINYDCFTRIVTLVKEFNASNYRGLNISLSFVIGSHNITQIKDMSNISSSILLPGSRISFYPEWTHHENRENKITKDQLKELLDYLPKIKTNLKKSCIYHNLDILPYVLHGISLSAEQNYPTREYYMKHPCITVSNYFVILADGRVVPCCRSSYILGNINQQSIHDIWFSKKANNFRYQASIIHKNKCELIQSHCFSCDHLMGNEYFHKRYSKDLA